VGAVLELQELFEADYFNVFPDVSVESLSSKLTLSLLAKWE